jgi:hypothetical protein
VGLFLIAAAVGGCRAAYHASEKTVTATVLKAERVTHGTGDSQTHRYLVFTDNGTFECTDSLLYGKFNSADVYGRLAPGSRYTFRLTGWRWEPGSWYPNILSATPGP